MIYGVLNINHDRMANNKYRGTSGRRAGPDDDIVIYQTGLLPQPLSRLNAVSSCIDYIAYEFNEKTLTTVWLRVGRAVNLTPIGSYYKTRPDFYSSDTRNMYFNKYEKSKQNH